MNNSIEIRPPGSNRVFIFLRVKDTRENISFIRFNDPPLNLRYGPATEGVLSKAGTTSIYTSFYSRR